MRKRKNMQKRVLSLILSFLMIVGMFDYSVFAASYGDGAASENKTIQVNGVEYSYKVTLPEGYDDTDDIRRYPVLYLMPENGLTGNPEALTTELASILGGNTTLDMIIVEPEFISTETNSAAGVYDTVREIIAVVDAEYNTVASPSARAVAGCKVGGYLASILTYTDGAGNWNASSGPVLFGLMASIHGDYTSDANPWKSVYGDFYQIAATNGTNNNGNFSNAIANRFYTYMTAASEDSLAYTANGANDVISYFINRGGAYGGFYYTLYGNADASVLQLAVKNSQYDDAFLKEAADEVIEGFGNKLAKGMVTGTLSITPQAANAGVESITATYELDVTNVYTQYCGTVANDLKLTISMTDPDTGEKVAEDKTVTISVNENSYDNELAPITLPNTIVNGSTTVTLKGEILGKEIIIDSQPLIRVATTGSEPENQLIDLLGNWRFYAFKGDGSDGKDALVVGTLPQKTQYDNWEYVQPCLGWWDSSHSTVTDMKSYTGYAWYVKEFEIPASFPEGEYVVPVGYFDETDMVFINGVKIGNTGLSDETWTFAGDFWDTERIYSISSDDLNIGGTNVITVLTYNQSGDGGWYDGHPGLYSAAAYNKLTSKPSTPASEADEAIVRAAVAAQKNALETKNAASYAATVDPEYFQSGITKTTLLETAAGYMEGDGTVAVSDTNSYVFVADGLYYYQADRTITTASGETVTSAVEDYYQIENGTATLYGKHDRFYTQSIMSEYRAQASGSTETALQENFLVYLPEGYFDEANANKRYPVAYVLHQLNSSSNSYAIDGIDKLLDQGIAEGSIKDTILVIPDSTGNSWWRNGWDKMVTDEILPFIDENYRTIADARYRFTTGASMGGGGAYYIGLTNPNLFSGITSFFGAINMGANPLNIALNVSDEYLAYFNHYFVSGNRDLYKFGIPAITLDKKLRTAGADHFFEIEEGEHDSSFYLPYVIDAFSYQTEKMDVVTDDQAKAVINGVLTDYAVANGTVTAHANINITSEIENYLNVIPASDYTTATHPDLVIPVTATVKKDGVVVATETQYLNADEAKTEAMTFTLSNYDITDEGTYDVSVSANLLTGSVNIPKQEYQITIQNDGNGTASADIVKTVQGSVVTLTASPAEGYQFSKWEVVSGNVTISSDNRFLMPASDVIIKAVFVQTPANPNTNGTGTDNSQVLGTVADAPNTNGTGANTTVQAPNTGDANGMPWMILMLFAGIAVTASARRKMKRKI